MHCPIAAIFKSFWLFLLRSKFSNKERSVTGRNDKASFFSSLSNVGYVFSAFAEMFLMSALIIYAAILTNNSFLSLNIRFRLIVELPKNAINRFPQGYQS